MYLVDFSSSSFWLLSFYWSKSFRWSIFSFYLLVILLFVIYQFLSQLWHCNNISFICLHSKPTTFGSCSHCIHFNSNLRASWFIHLSDCLSQSPSPSVQLPVFPYLRLTICSFVTIHSVLMYFPLLYFSFKWTEHESFPTISIFLLAYLLASRGGHTGLFLEIPYETPESGGLLNVEKDRKKIGYPCLKEK